MSKFPKGPLMETIVADLLNRVQRLEEQVKALVGHPRVVPPTNLPGLPPRENNLPDGGPATRRLASRLSSASVPGKQELIWHGRIWGTYKPEIVLLALSRWRKKKSFSTSKMRHHLNKTYCWQITQGATLQNLRMLHARGHVMKVGRANAHVATWQLTQPGLLAATHGEKKS